MTYLREESRQVSPMEIALFGCEENLGTVKIWQDVTMMLEDIPSFYVFHF